ncbi:MAG: class I SAM-dependent methyltransferase [Burkholderiales bacterium]|nr:class I SAM-dependent methyltransferase [Burkholderiales bacterium]
MNRTPGFAALLLWLWALCFAGIAAAQAPATHDHGFHDAGHWARIFDNPDRDTWQKPEEVIRALELKPDAAVADIGAGTGYFAVRLARAVPNGRVYAVDVEQEMVAYLEKRARHEGLSNLQPVPAEPDDARLPEPVDLVLMVNTYHHIEDREEYFARLAKLLKPGGRLAIIDFRPDAPIGPPKRVRIEAEKVIEELQEAGYTLSTRHDFLPHQYFLILTPKPDGRS